MRYIHTRHGHSAPVNHPADDLCATLNRISEEEHAARLEQIRAGTAPATPWQYELLALAYRAFCANSAEPVLATVIGWKPSQPCPACKTVHPVE